MNVVYYAKDGEVWIISPKTEAKAKAKEEWLASLIRGKIKKIGDSSNKIDTMYNKNVMLQNKLS